MNLHQYCLTESFRLDSCDGLIKHTHLIDWMSYVKYTLTKLEVQYRTTVDAELLTNEIQLLTNPFLQFLQMSLIKYLIFLDIYQQVILINHFINLVVTYNQVAAVCNILDVEQMIIL
ncbi:unnamed protein product [Paramecium pentaurelia]|uniref:Uncharacterized protein n=1 Tax=Paramecium pentaurelia TaxID=43138 RepID=A0A8S1SHB4_9CILI|nr:unnamed protein product [Paramecium pentaurelia]